MDIKPAISVRGIKKHFGKTRAVDGIDLNIYPGEFLALLGPNGAGKTTLVEMIEGIQSPDSGHISIKGMNWKDHRRKLRGLLGISLQETHFIDKLRVGETLALFTSFYNLGRERINAILDLVNLQEKEHSFIKNLSGGQKQRLALGIAFINRPDVLLLDEPTTGLDPTARREIWNILLEMKKQHNTTMILTTHYMEEAEYLCDRIVVIDQGKVLAQGTMEELLSEHDSSGLILFNFVEDTNQFEVPENGASTRLTYSEKESLWILNVRDIVTYLPEFLQYMQTQNLTLRTLECRKMTLEDLFLKMTGRRLNDQN